MTIKSGKLVILMILVAGVLIVPAFADFYEDVFDPCENFTNVSGFTEGMIANSTFWGFNNSMTGIIPENTGAYTENDAQGWITVNSQTSVTIKADMDQTVYLARDLGLNNIGDFDVSFSVDPISHISNGRAYGFYVSKTVGGGQQNVDLIGYRVRWSTSDVKYQHALVTRESSVNIISSYLEPVGDPIRYARITKVGSNVTLWIFSDSDHTGYIFSVSHILASDVKYRYLYWVGSDNIPLGSREMEIVVDDLKGFNSSGLSAGYIYTTQLINGSKPMVFSTQAKYDNGNSIAFSFSDDNITWVNQQNFLGGADTPGTGWQAFNLEKMDWDTVYIRMLFLRNVGIGDCDLRQWRLFYTSEGGQGNITILAGAFAEYNVSSIDVLVGTYVHGNLTSTQFVDGKTYKVDEVTGSPGFDVRFNFTGVPENSTSLSLRSFVEYEGNPAHIVNIEAWNFINKEWVFLSRVPENSFNYYNVSLSIGGFIQNDTGKVWIRIKHDSQGSAGHWLNVDYLRLRAFVPTGGTVNVDAWGINWLLSIIWLALVAIGVFDKNNILKMFAGFFGIILSILMFTENMMVAVALISINLYLLYEGTE